MTKIITPKETALSKNTALTPAAATIIPPNAGPTARAKLTDTPPNAIALDNSSTSYSEKIWALANRDIILRPCDRAP